MAARNSRAVVEPKAGPLKAHSKFKPGDKVVVTNGISRGLRGVIVNMAPDFAPGIPAWIVDLLDCRDRQIRADYLERDA